MIIRLRCQRSAVDDGRIIARVFIAPDPNKTFQLAGTLNLCLGEWQVFGAALLLGAEKMKGHLTVECPDDDEIIKAFTENPQVPSPTKSE